MRISAQHDAERIIANLALYSTAVQYSVTSALRRAAQYTRTHSRRRISRQSGIRQKDLSKRISAHRDRKTTRVNYRVWLGYRYRYNAARSKIARVEALAQPATFRMPSGTIMRRMSRAREDLEPVEFSLEDYIPDVRRIARIAFRRVYKQRLRAELSRRARRAQSSQQARALERATRALATKAANERSVSHGN